jgi:hypothetical protein
VPLSAMIMIPNSLGYVGDVRVPEERRGVDWELLRSNRLIIIFCLVVAACAVINAVIDLVFFDAHLAQMIYALSCTVCVPPCPDPRPLVRGPCVTRL